MKLFFQVAVVLLGMMAANLFAQDQVPAPTFKEGEVWQFNATSRDFLTDSSDRLSGTYELTYSQGKVKVNLLTGDKKEAISTGPDYPGENLVALLGLSEIYGELKFPLSVGQKWSYRYTVIGGRGKVSSRSVDVNVSGVEQVTAPAGSFKAFKIVTEGSWQGVGAGATRFTRTITNFYSPETRSVIKSSYTNSEGARREIELIKFDSGK